MKTSEARVPNLSDAKLEHSRIFSVERELAELLNNKLGNGFPVVESYSDQIRRIATKNDLEDANFFNDIENVCLNIIEYGPVLEKSIAISILLDCAGYFYESIGRHKKQIELEQYALAHAVEISDFSLQRRAHNCLAVAYMRVYDFSNACMHNEKAYRLANEEKNELHIFATLANSVAILQEMGLLHSARKLAVRLRDGFQDGLYFDCLHLINANNGLKICHLLDDTENAQIFYQKANKKSRSECAIISDITRAYFEAGRCEYLTRNGSPDKAIRIISKALQRASSNGNPKIVSILLCAQAEAYIATRKNKEIESCRDQLKELLSNSLPYSSYYEEILRTLVKTYTLNGENESAENKRWATEYLIILREYVLCVKHRSFFTTESSGPFSSVQQAEHLQNPRYEIPSWIVCESGEDAPPQHALNVIPQRSLQLDSLPFHISHLSGRDCEKRLRTLQYDIAENWAVAAEFLTGNDGRHAFRLGKLAAAIATRLGWSIEESTVLEMACRLHNVGNVAIAVSPAEFNALRPLGQFSALCDHTHAGEKLLGSSSDRVLRLSALIAKNHHEWWNGCGYPGGRSGSTIPLEARICAIADTFISLIAPAHNVKPWEIDSAMRQVESMGSIQLDPNLLLVLNQIITDGAGVEAGVYYSREFDVKVNRLVMAKNKLFDALELIEC